MNPNDKRLNAYKRAAGFQPKKVTADEAARTNAAIEAFLRPQTEEAISQLQSGKKAESEKTEESFKPFSFDSVPVFKSKTENDDADLQQKTESQKKDEKKYASLGASFQDSNQKKFSSAAKSEVSNSPKKNKSVASAYDSSMPRAFPKKTNSSIENKKTEPTSEPQISESALRALYSGASQNNQPLRSTVQEAIPQSVAQNANKKTVQKQEPVQPVRQIIPPQQIEENQFDFAAFAAKNGNKAFQPKKFETQSLDELSSPKNLNGMVKTTVEKLQVKTPPTVQSLSPLQQQKSTPKKENILGTQIVSQENSSDVLYKIPAKADNPYRRVAKFLVLIGVDDAAKVIAHLPPEHVDKIIPEIASVRSVDETEKKQILAEFSHLIKQARETGGITTARSILEKAFGTDRADEMLQKTVPFNGEKPFDYLKDIDSDRLTIALKDESIPVKALVLSQVKPSVAASVIKEMSDVERKDTVQRLAKLGSIAPDILARIDRTMREKVQKLQMPFNDSIDGRSALAEILRKMDPISEKNILNNLSNFDSDLEHDMRKRLFTLTDVLHADDLFIQKRLNIMTEHDIAVLICGKKEDFRKKILANISRGRGATVLDEEALGKPFSKKESNTVTNAFISYLRESWERGDLIMTDRDEEDWII